MFSLIQKILNQVRSFDALSKRVEKIEAKLKRFEKLADENESLWQFLDEEKEAEADFQTHSEDYQEELNDILIRRMKPYGDA